MLSQGPRRVETGASPLETTAPQLKQKPLSQQSQPIKVVMRSAESSTIAISGPDKTVKIVEVGQPSDEDKQLRQAQW